MVKTNTTSLTIKSMWWKTLILFLQTSKLCCMSLRTTKQWSRWSLKEGVLQRDMFPRPTELRLIGCSIELTWTQNPNQVHRHQKPTRWHSNQWKFHTWWEESFVVLVQYQPFQFYSVLWYSGETISTRFRRRTRHSKIVTDDELYCKDAVARIILVFKARRREVMEVKIPGVLLVRHTSDWGRPDETSWRTIRLVRPGHEETLHDGTAQSVMNE